MSAISTAFRGLAKVADATTATAGAVGGAAISGVAKVSVSVMGLMARSKLGASKL